MFPTSHGWDDGKHAKPGALREKQTDFLPTKIWKIRQARHHQQIPDRKKGLFKTI
jgi:hypothetical protein